MKNKNAFSLGVAAFLGLTQISGVSAQQASAAETRQQINLPAGPLANALDQLADQAGVQIMYETALTDGIRVHAVSGPLSFQAALVQLLANTGLRADAVHEKMVVLKRAPIATGDALHAEQMTLAQVSQTSMGDEGAAASGKQNESRSAAGEVQKDAQEVVVTGSLIRGAAPASPHMAITRQDIEKAGFSTVQQLLDNLPQNYNNSATEKGWSGTGDRSALSNRGSGSTVNLRGLGGGSSLVLVNGRRMAPTMDGHFVDVSMIPVSAIERVEIVTDGASAMYGSDAVGGVVNFILRENFDGMETRLRMGTVTEGNLNETAASQAWGTGWSSGTLMLSYDYYQRDRLRASDRDFSQNAADPTDLMVATRRNTALAMVRQQVGERVGLFGDAMYSRRNNIGVLSRNADTTDSHKYEVEQWNFTAGAEVELGGSWAGEISGLYSANDAGNQSLSVLGSSSFASFYTSKYTLKSLEAKADGALFELPTGTARLALGGSARQEEISGTSRGVRTRNDGLKRDVKAVYAEVLVPLVSQDAARRGLTRLELTMAGRYEEYDDFGSSSDPKFGLLYSPFVGLNLRSTYSTSFKAPYLEDLNTAGNSLLLFSFPDPAQADNEALFLDLEGGNANLKPEQSTTWSAGFDWEPESMPGFKLGMTYFDIRYKQRITLLTTAVPEAINSISTAVNLEPFVKLNPSVAEVNALLNSGLRFIDYYRLPYTPADIEAIADNRLVNASVTKVRGMDLSLSYAAPSRLGDLSFRLDGSYMKDFEESVTDRAPLISIIDTYLRPISLTLRGSAGLSRGGASATVFANYRDAYVDNLSTPKKPISSWTTFDLNLAYETSDRFSGGLLDDLRLSLNVQNIFDKAPPFVSNASSQSTYRVDYGYDPANGNPLGRFAALSLTKRWK